MGVVNIFSACALYSYYKTTNLKASVTQHSIVNMFAKNISTPQKRLHEVQVLHANEIEDFELKSITAQTTIPDRITQASQNCLAQKLIFLHITEKQSHHTSRSLSILQRIIKKSHFFVVLIVGVDLFQAVYRDWCYSLTQQCQLSVVTPDISEWTDSTMLPSSDLETRVMSIPISRVLNHGMMSTPRMCIDGVILIGSSFVADIGFKHRLQNVPRDKLACLFANSPPLCSEEAMWIPYNILSMAMDSSADIELFARHDPSQDHSSTVVSSVNLLVAKVIKLGKYAGSFPVVAKV